MFPKTIEFDHLVTAIKILITFYFVLLQRSDSVWLQITYRS